MCIRDRAQHAGSGQKPAGQTFPYQPKFPQCRRGGPWHGGNARRRQEPGQKGNLRPHGARGRFLQDHGAEKERQLTQDVYKRQVELILIVKQLLIILVKIIII